MEFCKKSSSSMQDYEFEYRMISADGRIVWLHDIVSVESIDGAPKTLRGFMMDITGRKQTEEDLQRSEERFRRALETAPDGMLLVRPDGTIALANEQMEKLFGYGREELIGQGMEVLALEGFRTEQVHRRRDGFGDSCVRPRGAGLELYGRRKDGSEVPVEIRLSPLETQEGVLVCAAIRDITNRKEAEEALEKQRAFLKQVIDADPNFIFAKDREGRFILVNQAVADVYGTTVEDLIGKTDADFNPNVQEVEFFRRMDLEVMDTLQERFIPEERVTDAQGRVRWFQTVKRPMIGEDGTADRVLGSATDITQLKRAMETLRQRTEQTIRHQAVLLALAQMDNADLLAAQQRITEEDAKTLGVERVSIWLFNEDRSAIACQDLYRLSRNAHERGLRLQARQYPRYFHALEENRAVAANDAQSDPRTSEFTEGYLKPFEITSMMDVPVWLHGKVVGIVCHEHSGPIREWQPEEQEFAASIADVVSLALAAGERNRMEQALCEREAALRESQMELRELAGKLLTAQEVERRRLAREMHDDLTQRLAVLAIGAGRLEGQFESSDREVHGKLRQMKEQLVKLAADVHAISRQLHPSILDDLGLVDAMEAECATFSVREGIVVTYTPKNVPVSVPKDVALCLYRIAQEGLRNLAKHAQAPEASVSLEGKDDVLILTIEDTGIGFDPAQIRGKGGLGLASMEERARLIQADFCIDSQPGKGTVIEVRAPLRGRQE